MAVKKPGQNCPGFLIENPRFPPSLASPCLVITRKRLQYFCTQLGRNDAGKAVALRSACPAASPSVLWDVGSFSATEIAFATDPTTCFFGGLQFCGPVSLLDFVIQQPQFLGKAIHGFLYFLHIYRAQNFNLRSACPVG